MAYLKFGSSWVIKAPCKVNGIECSERTMGCRNNCEKYAEYQEKLYEFKRNMLTRQKRENRLDDYATDQKIKYIGGKKYER